MSMKDFYVPGKEEIKKGVAIRIAVENVHLTVRTVSGQKKAEQDVERTSAATRRGVKNDWTSKQSEGLVKEFDRAFSYSSNEETKLSGEIKDVKRDIKDVEVRLGSDIKESASRLFIRLGALIVVVGDILGSMLEFLRVIHP